MYGHALTRHPIRGPRGGAARMYRGLTGRRAARDPPRQEGPSIMATIEQLRAFFEQGWNRHDVDALMTFMADDCVFESASGPDVCGTRHAGRERVREAFARIFAAFPDVRFADLRHFVAGDRGVS